MVLLSIKVGDIRINKLKNKIISIKKGMALTKLKKYAEAIACFDRAIQLNPNDSETYNQKGKF
jgi:Flp pilus assembly protein TadD